MTHGDAEFSSYEVTKVWHDVMPNGALTQLHMCALLSLFQVRRVSEREREREEAGMRFSYPSR